MIEIWLFLKSISLKEWLYLAITAIVLYFSHSVYDSVKKIGSDEMAAKDATKFTEQDTKYQKQLADKQKTIDADAELYKQSLIDASNQSQAWQAKTDKANEVANNAQIKLQSITADNRKLTDSLQQLTSKADERISLPDTPKDAITEYTAVLGGEFEGCANAYLELASKARANGIDEQALIDSYPK